MLVGVDTDEAIDEAIAVLDAEGSFLGAKPLTEDRVAITLDGGVKTVVL